MSLFPSSDTNKKAIKYVSQPDKSDDTSAPGNVNRLTMSPSSAENEERRRILDIHSAPDQVSENHKTSQLKTRSFCKNYICQVVIILWLIGLTAMAVCHLVRFENHKKQVLKDIDFFTSAIHYLSYSYIGKAFHVIQDIPPIPPENMVIQTQLYANAYDTAYLLSQVSVLGNNFTTINTNLNIFLQMMIDIESSVQRIDVKLNLSTVTGTIPNSVSSNANRLVIRQLAFALVPNWDFRLSWINSINFNSYSGPSSSWFFDNLVVESPSQRYAGYSQDAVMDPSTGNQVLQYGTALYYPAYTGHYFASLEIKSNPEPTMNNLLAVTQNQLQVSSNKTLSCSYGFEFADAISAVYDYSSSTVIYTTNVSVVYTLVVGSADGNLLNVDVWTPPFFSATVTQLDLSGHNHMPWIRGSDLVTFNNSRSTDCSSNNQCFIGVHVVWSMTTTPGFLVPMAQINSFHAKCSVIDVI